MDASLLHYTKKGLFPRLVVGFHKGQTAVLVQVVSELIFVEDWTLKVPLIGVEVVQGQTCPLVILKFKWMFIVVDGQTFPLIECEGLHNHLVIVDLEVHWELLVSKILLLKLVDQMLMSTPDQCCKNSDCSLADEGGQDWDIGSRWQRRPGLSPLKLLQFFRDGGFRQKLSQRVFRDKVGIGPLC